MVKKIELNERYNGHWKLSFTKKDDTHNLSPLLNKIKDSINKKLRFYTFKELDDITGKTNAYLIAPKTLDYLSYTNDDAVLAEPNLVLPDINYDNCKISGFYNGVLTEVTADGATPVMILGRIENALRTNKPYVLKKITTVGIETKVEEFIVDASYYGYFIIQEK